MRNTVQRRLPRKALRGAALAIAGLALASVLAARGAAAQPPGPPPSGQPGMGGPGGQGGPGRMQAMLFEGITLDATQKAKVDSLNAAFRERMMAQRESAPAGPPDSATMAARRTMMQEHRAALRAVLNADQQKTFDANAQKMDQRMRERGGGPGRPPGGER